MMSAPHIWPSWVTNEKTDPRETLLDYARTINEEIVKKRNEFGLPVPQAAIDATRDATVVAPNSNPIPAE